MWQENIITTVATILSWGFVLGLITVVYRKQEQRAKAWKIVIAYFVGMVSFSFTFTYFNQLIRISILPLGVLILYAILTKRNSWEKYRKYAWIGFASNFIFLISSLITTPIHHWIFPQHEINTFINDLAEAQVIATHPSANASALLQDDALQTIQLAQEAKILSDEWYYELVMTEDEETREKFPYILIDVQAKWGSGYKPSIYIEEDGKGILITTDQQQFYFRTSQSVLSEVAKHE